MVSQAQVCHTFAIGVLFWISTRERLRLCPKSAAGSTRTRGHKSHPSLQALVQGWGNARYAAHSGQLMGRFLLISGPPGQPQASVIQLHVTPLPATNSYPKLSPKELGRIGAGTSVVTRDVLCHTLTPQTPVFLHAGPGLVSIHAGHGLDVLAKASSPWAFKANAKGFHLFSTQSPLLMVVHNRMGGHTANIQVPVWCMGRGNDSVSPALDRRR